MYKLEYVQKRYSNKKIWYYASTVTYNAKIPDVINILVLFIRQQWNIEEELNRNNYVCKKIQAGLSHILSRFMALLWYGKNSGNINRLEKNCIIYISN